MDANICVYRNCNFYYITLIQIFVSNNCLVACSMLKIIYAIRHFFEKHGFYVSSRLAERLGIRVKNVRLFFIYLSFATVGIGFAFYITLAFLLRLKDLIYTKRNSVFDL